MFRNDLEFDEALVDSDYLRRKQELAKRITEHRGKRIKLRQELSAYKKFEKTNEKPIEDPALASQVMKLNSDIQSETELNTKLKSREINVNNQLDEIKKQIQEITDLIQKYKVEKQPEIISNTGMDHLKEREQNLIQAFKTKKQKQLELENELNRLTKESDIKSKQNAVVTQIENWQQGNVAEPTDPAHIQQAFVAYKTSNECWREAKFNYDRKNLMPDFYVLSLKALKNGIDAHYLLISQTDDDISNIPLQEKIDLLYRNKIVVNTTLLDSLVNFVDRINHNVEVTPQPNYPEKIFEFMIRNMTSLKTS